jgi:hypothetical protein
VLATLATKKVRAQRDGPRRQVESKFDLFRYVKRVVDFDPEISDCAFQLCVTQQELAALRLLVFLCINAAFVRRIKRVPRTELSRPALSTHFFTIRAYCRVEMCGRSEN